MSVVRIVLQVFLNCFLTLQKDPLSTDSWIGSERNGNYNNLMYMQVGYIAEVLGGASFEDLLRDRILNKLNMTNAVFLPQIDEVNNLAMPYENINDSLLQSNMEAYKCVHRYIF